jgi:cytochrome c556
MRKRVLVWGLCLSLLGVSAGAALAQFASKEDAVKYRQSAMFLMGQHFGRMGAMMKGSPSYDKDVFIGNAVLVEGLFKNTFEAFSMPDSDKGSAMKPEALNQKEAFRKVYAASEAEYTNLAQAAKSGDSNAVKAPFGEAAKTCKACHSQYRGR